MHNTLMVLDEKYWLKRKIDFHVLYRLPDFLFLVPTQLHTLE